MNDSKEILNGESWKNGETKNKKATLLVWERIQDTKYKRTEKRQRTL